MKLTLHKLGRIEHAEIDVRPLTVFIGPNGTNKTWAAYALYGLLRRFSMGPSSLQEVPELATFMQFVDVLKSQLAPIVETLAQTPPPTRVEGRIGTLFGRGAAPITASINGGYLQKLLFLPDAAKTGMSATLEISAGEITSLPLDVDLVLERPRNRLILRTHYSEQGTLSKRAVETVRSADSWTEDEVLRFVVEHMVKVFGNVIVLPAERKGLVAVVDALTESPQRILSLPLADFVEFLRLARGMVADAPSQVSAKLGVLLAGAAGGDVGFSDGDSGRRLVFRARNGVELPLLAASSLARAVAGLAIYVRQFLQPDDILIIDELEMNAHPQAQLALVELMAALVNQGVRVVFTTHSPYIVDHLNNLMEAWRVPVERQAALAEKFALKTPQAFISSDRVAVWAFEETSTDGAVEVRETLNRESGLITWSTFGKVSDQVSNLYADILLALPEET